MPPETEPIPSTGKVILNANRGITNIVRHNTIRTDLQHVADYLFTVLKNHYGPYSGFAALADPKGQLKDTQFTKDGIDIIRSLEFASPQEEWVRKTISFIGTKIEAHVGDGTTSSMMFTCAMLKRMSQHIEELRPISHIEMTDAYEMFRENLQHFLKFATARPYYTEKNGNVIIDHDLVRKIAYNQAFTASHGNTKLANDLAEVFVTTPKCLWERMTWQRCKHEREIPFWVEQTEGQYQIDGAEIFSKSMYNKDLSTWFEVDNATFLILNNEICCNTPEAEKIFKAIDDATKETPTVILCPRQMDHYAYNELMTHLNKAAKEGRTVAVFGKSFENASINDYVALQALIGEDITKYRNGGLCIKTGVYIKNYADKLVIDKLYEVPEKYKNSSRLERHMVYDGEHIQFVDYLESVKKYADGMDTVNMTATNRQEQTMYYRMYGKLTYSKTSVMIIGGSTHDNLALTPIVDDCIRAIARALSNGVVFSNNRSLYCAVSHLAGNGYVFSGSKTHYSNDNRVIRQIAQWIAKRTKEALEDIAMCVVDDLYPKKHFFKFQKRDFVKWWYSHAVDMLKFPKGGKVHWSKLDEKTFPPVDRYTSPAAYLQDPKIDRVIIQPANSDITMLDRFAEVALKFILTECIVMKDGAYLDKKKKD